MGKEEAEFLREIAKKHDAEGVRVEEMEVTERSAETDEMFRARKARELENKMKEADQKAQIEKKKQELLEVSERLQKKLDEAA